MLSSCLDKITICYSILKITSCIFRKTKQNKTKATFRFDRKKICNIQKAKHDITCKKYLPNRTKHTNMHFKRIIKNGIGKQHDYQQTPKPDLYQEQQTVRY